MSRISQRIANRRSEPLQKLIVFRIRQEWFAVLIQFAQKVIPLGLGICIEIKSQWDALAF